MDRLSQLQTCLDQLVTQFFSSLNYVNRHHDFVPLREGDAKVEDPNSQQEVVPPEEFQASLTELAQDIVTKSKQIETLIDSLPGLENIEDSQLTQLDELDGELQEAREEEKAVIEERKELLQRCDKIILQLTEDKAAIEQLT